MLRQREAQLDEAQARLASARAAPDQVAFSRAQADQVAGKIAQLEATVRLAQLDLSYTKLYAPESGRIKGLAQRLADSGLGTYEAQREAYARVYRVVRDQAQTLAFIDMYWLLAAAAAVMVAVAFTLRKNDPRLGGQVIAH
jgi:multidrug efflux pump subunit AcrA (membrane-fusion protein)